jgi:hypothetical protein
MPKKTKADVMRARTHKPPRMCYVIVPQEFVPEQGFRACVCIEGETGYRPTGNWPYHGRVGETMPYFWGLSLDEAEQAAKKQNERLGLTEKDVAIIIASTMREDQRHKKA